MIITCSSCSTKYSISKKVLGENGKKVKCSNCGHEWYQKLDIIKKSSQTRTLKEQQISIDDVNKEADTTKIFSSEIEKKRNYKFLYLLIFIILISKLKYCLFK